MGRSSAPAGPRRRQKPPRRFGLGAGVVIIELEIAGMHHQPNRRSDAQPDAIRDTVADVKRFDGEGAKRQRIPSFEDVQWVFAVPGLA